jgi:aldehyde:ferredoxin oxidoreductase
MVPKKLYHLKGSTLISLARLKHYATLFKAVTGLDRSTAELLRVGWQIHEVEKAFNTLHARFSRKDDLPPMRVFTEPVKTGLWRRFKLSWERYNEMLTEYYSLHGWDPETGWQRREPLQKLGLKEVADKLDRYGCLSS